MSVDDTKYYEMADRAGIVFNGLQNNPFGNTLPLFTHPDYGTFAMQNGETLNQALERKRIQYSTPADKA